MWFTSFRDYGKTGSRDRSAESRRISASRSRLRLEILEERTLLSVCTVDRLTDTGDGSSRMGDLRYCITNATDGDTVIFTDGLVGTINLTRALPDLTHSVSINGPGADLITVRRNTGGDYRIFTVGAGTMVSMDSLTLANGIAYGYDGGGIFNRGTLTVSNSTLSGNFAGQFCDDFGCHGGGSAGGIFNMGTLTVSGSTFSNNGADVYNGGAGGGIFNAGTLTVSNSTFSRNSAYAGGAIVSSSGMAVISGSTFSENSAYATGAIGNGVAATLNVSGSTFSGNSGSGGNGGVGNGGTLIVIDSTFSGNSAGPGDGGGISNSNSGMLTVSDSTFAGNRAGFFGAGISNAGTLTVSNSTFTGNLDGGGGGGAIFNAGTLSVSNSTFSGNSSDTGGGAIYSRSTLIVSDGTFSGNLARFGGGGIATDGATLHARNTIIAGNTGGPGYAPDLGGSLGSLGHNLIGNTDGAGGFDPTDLLNVDALLGPLQDNGGPTLTMALQCGSPAIDAGDNTDAPEWDQRGEGFPRIVNGIIDIGAYEVQQGECDGSARHTQRENSNPVGTALLLHETPRPGFTNVQLSADVQRNTYPLVSQYVGRTRTQSENVLVSHPRPKGPVQDSVFTDMNWDNHSLLFWEEAQ